jgi:hypothetical protein
VVLGDRQQVVDDLEALGPLRVIDAGDLHQLLIFEAVAKRRHTSSMLCRGDGDRILADRVAAVEPGVADRGLDLIEDARPRRNDGS